MRSEFVNTGILAAKAISVINSCKTLAQFNSAKKYAKLVEREIDREFKNRRDRTMRANYGFNMGLNLTAHFKDNMAAFKPVIEALQDSPFNPA